MFRRFFWKKLPAHLAVTEETATIQNVQVPTLPEDNPSAIKPTLTDEEPTS
jgi:hypothetical protein